MYFYSYIHCIVNVIDRTLMCILKRILIYCVSHRYLGLIKMFALVISVRPGRNLQKFFFSYIQIHIVINQEARNLHAFFQLIPIYENITNFQKYISHNKKPCIYPTRRKSAEGVLFVRTTPSSTGIQVYSYTAAELIRACVCIYIGSTRARHITSCAPAALRKRKITR